MKSKFLKRSKFNSIEDQIPLEKKFNALGIFCFADFKKRDWSFLFFLIYVILESYPFCCCSLHRRSNCERDISERSDYWKAKPSGPVVLRHVYSEIAWMILSGDVVEESQFWEAT